MWDFSKPVNQVTSEVFVVYKKLCHDSSSKLAVENLLDSLQRQWRRHTVCSFCINQFNHSKTSKWYFLASQQIIVVLPILALPSKTNILNLLLLLPQLLQPWWNWYIHSCISCIFLWATHKSIVLDSLFLLTPKVYHRHISVIIFDVVNTTVHFVP